MAPTNNCQHVDEPAPQREGMSAFALQDGVIHHTYSGRNDDPEQSRWRRHDEHETRQEEEAR